MELLNRAQVAELLGVTDTTLRFFVRKCGLPCRKLSARTTRFIRSEVEAWVKSHPFFVGDLCAPVDVSDDVSVDDEGVANG